MNTFTYILRMLMVVMLPGLLAACGGEPPATTRQNGEHESADIPALTPEATTEKREILFYRHPMNPDITSPVPREDSMGMPYIPVYADTSTDNVISISPALVQNLGVATAPVEQGDLPRLIDAVGYVTWNNRQTHYLQPRAPGWIEAANVYSVGEPVQAGQKLFSYYAPEIVTAQRDYLRALAAGGKALIGASRERLLALGMAEREIATIEKTRQTLRAIGFYAREDGVVTLLNIRQGMYVMPATQAVGLTRLDSVWIEAEVFARHARWLKPGQSATATFPALPGETFTGTLDYLAPAVDAVTRSRTARFTLPNPEHKLMPGMYGEVQIQAQAINNAVHIPLDALIRTGEATRVVLALGEGRFASREVTAGDVTGDRVVITRGLTAGERVVTSAQFLLDSEASLRQTVNRLGEETDAADKTMEHKDMQHTEHGTEHGHGGMSR